MNPRLVSVAGPLEGTTFALTEDEASIGRERANRLWINDALVSRRHCLVRREGDRFSITDLGSFNGTKVNGVPVKERNLNHGDMISVGDSLFLFLVEGEEAAPAVDNLEFCEEMPGAETTVQLRIEDAIYLHPEKVQQVLGPTARMARDLNALFKVSATINSVRALDQLVSKLVESIFEIIPARLVAILLAREGTQEFISTFGKDRNGGAVQVSRTIAARVLKEGIALLISNIADSTEFDEAESLRASVSRSLLCVPLAVFGKTFGVIYMDTSDTETSFDENHLQLVAAIASISSVAIENVRHIEWLESENARLQIESTIEHSMIGDSRAMREIYHFISRVAATDSTVLVTGESGTGKELAARAIHLNSPRASKSFVAINCAAIAESLLESELFGHERGAFTGALGQKKGKFELADGGTIFLDEIGELAPLLQAKLLRVLQEREFERVGSTRPFKINVRVIAATNRELEEEVRRGVFRQDLYYRLNVVRLKMPSLRERENDVELLANHFARKCGQRCNRRIMGISEQARACLAAYDWPGNVRELENAIERAIVLGTSEIIMLDDLPDSLIERNLPEGAEIVSFYEMIKEAKRQAIVKAMEQANGSYKEAARALRMHPNNLHRHIRNLDLKPYLKK